MDMADTQQAMVTEREQREAIARLRDAASSGEVGEVDLARREAAVWKAVTPRDLWKATGGRAGSPQRSDAREWRRAVIVMVAMIVAAAVVWGVIVLLVAAVEDPSVAG